MKTRKLGLDGPEVSAISLGCMNLTGYYAPTDKQESFECLALPCDLFQTRDKNLSQFITCFWSTLYDEAHTF